MRKESPSRIVFGQECEDDKKIESQLPKTLAEQLQSIDDVGTVINRNRNKGRNHSRSLNITGKKLTNM
jgi:hypothetical protein